MEVKGKESTSCSFLKQPLQIAVIIHKCFLDEVWICFERPCDLNSRPDLPQTRAAVEMFSRLPGFGPWSPCAAPFKERFVYELKWTSRVLNVYGLRGLRLDLGAFFEVERMLMNH